MRLTVNAGRLAEAARNAARAVRADQGKRNQILKCCRLTADGNLEIYSTDLDTGISASADCDVNEPGEAVVDAQRLAEIAAKLRGDVRVQTTADGLTIKCGRSRFTLTMLRVENFPDALCVDSTNQPIDLTAADVMALFDGAAAGAAQSDTRIYLAGVTLFSAPAGSACQLCGVGADSIALSHAGTEVGCSDFGQVIVHRETCRLAVDLFGRTGASVKLSNRLIAFASDSARLTAKLIDGIPIAWQSMVPPPDAANSALVANKDLRAALERCLAVADPLAKIAPGATLWWDAASAAELRIALGNINNAPAAVDSFSAKELNGSANINFNPKILLRLLAGLDTESTRLSVGGHRSDPLRIDAGPDRFAVLGLMTDSPHLCEVTA